MEFVVITRALDSTNVPPAASIALAKQTFQMFASNQDSRIKAVYPFAGERAGVLIVDVKSSFRSWSEACLSPASARRRSTR